MLASNLFDPTPSADTPIACTLSVIDDPESHVAQTKELFTERTEARTVDRGVALRFPGTIGYAERLLDFVRGERQCCPFLTFEIIFEPEERGIWLLLGGDEQVASYIQRQFEAQWT